MTTFFAGSSAEGQYSGYRFTNFVDSYGGMVEFSKEVEAYTRGNQKIKHFILRLFAERSGKGKVTKEESDIMKNVFIRIIAEGEWYEKKYN